MVNTILQERSNHPISCMLDVPEKCDYNFFVPAAEFNKIRSICNLFVSGEAILVNYLVFARVFVFELCVDVLYLVFHKGLLPATVASDVNPYQARTCNVLLDLVCCCNYI